MKLYIVATVVWLTSMPLTAGAEAGCADGTTNENCQMSPEQQKILLDSIGKQIKSGRFQIAEVRDLLKKNEFEEARNKLTERIEFLEKFRDNKLYVKDSQPGIADCTTLRAFVHFGLGDDKAALKDFDRAAVAVGKPNVSELVQQKEKHSKEEWQKLAISASETMTKLYEQMAKSRNQNSPNNAAAENPNTGLMKYPPSQID